LPRKAFHPSRDADLGYTGRPTVTKLADDRAEQLTRNPDKVVQELDKRVRADVRNTGDFSRVHALPHSGQDVPDDMDARLVVLGIDHPYSKEPGNSAETAAKAIFESRGNAPRLFANTLVFLALDKVRLQDLDEAIRRYLAWKSIVDEQEALNLDPHQVKQAETQLASAEGAVTARLPEAYQWLLVPVQTSPQAPVQWQAVRLSGQDALVVRASKKLRNDELLVTAFAGTSLRRELDKIPLWRGNHVPIKQLAEDFARYVYLPRLADPAVLFSAIRDGVGLLTWDKDSFAYADTYDEATSRYRGLRCGQIVSVSAEGSTGLLVRPEIATQQRAAEAPAPIDVSQIPKKPEDGARPERPPGPSALQPSTGPKRFHGSVELDPTRVGRDAGRIADEVISHLAGLVGTTVTVTLDIAAEIPLGAPDHVVRAVTENSRTLKFKTQGFERE
jgi:hypothetical protein